MNNEFIQTIKSLPPLPENLTELEEFKRLNNEDENTLVTIVNKDPLMTATILKVANSPLFGFRSQVDTIKKAINLLGINFTISIAIGSAIQNNLKSDLKAYNVSIDEFIQNCILSTKFVNSWVASISPELARQLILPAFLLDVGKFIISQVVEKRNLIKDFQNNISKTHNLSDLENSFIGYSTPRITANIFKHWSLSHNIIFPIAFIDNLESCPDDYIQHTKALHVIKILTNITEPLSDSSIEIALRKAREFGFDETQLQTCINAIKRKLDT